jgi:hypothetical protein
MKARMLPIPLREAAFFCRQDICGLEEEISRFDPSCPTEQANQHAGI